jgi:replicative DNA helicase
MNEHKIIGNILKSPKKRKEALELLKPEYFLDKSASDIFLLCQTIDKEEGIKKYSLDVFFELARKYEIDIDMVVASAAMDMDQFDIKEWMFVITTLIENYRKNEISESCIEIAREVSSGGINSTKAINNLKESIDKVAIEAVESSLTDSGKLMSDAIQRIKDRANKEGLSGCNTGFLELDELFDGYQKGDLMILAGRPAMGKTACALQKAVNLVKAGGKAIFFSLEMPKEQLMQRLVASESKIHLGKIKRGELHGYEWDKIEQDTKWLSKSNRFWIDDRSGITVDQIRATVRRANRNKDLNLVVIDYLQLIKPSTSYRGNRNNEIGEISRSLKILAKEENITVVVLSQLSRAVEQRDGKIPQLSDLRDSGEIEQDADIIVFAYRPEYYEIYEDAEGNSTKGLFMYLVKKNRSGELKNVKFNCDLSIQKIWGEGNEKKDNYVEPSPQDFPQNEKLDL